ncbi:MAG: phosphatase PAP2 family protein [Patescibacteria group bacterium]
MDILIGSIKEVSVVGSSPIIFVMAFFVALFLIIRQDYLRLLALALSLASGLYSSLLKYLFNEQRPIGYISDGFIPWERVLKSEIYSFPSTHTVLYTAFFGYLLYLSFKLKGVDKVTRHVTRFFFAFMIVFIGISRILLGAHFVKDVVSGYLFGLLYLGAVIYVERFLVQRLAKKPLKHKSP